MFVKWLLRGDTVVTSARGSGFLSRRFPERRLGSPEQLCGEKGCFGSSLKHLPPDVLRSGESGTDRTSCPVRLIKRGRTYLLPTLNFFFLGKEGSKIIWFMKTENLGDAWLAQPVESETLDLRVCKFEAHVGCRGYLKIKPLKQNRTYLFGEKQNSLGNEQMRAHFLRERIVTFVQSILRAAPYT